MTRRHWASLTAAAVLLLTLGLGIRAIYADPPLKWDGAMQCCTDRPRAMGIGLVNDGRWPLRLTGVTVEGQSGGYTIEALVTQTGEWASSAAVRTIIDQEQPPSPQIGPVADWEIEPTRWGEPRPMHGLRIIWEPGTPPPERIIVEYRYAMLPLRRVLDWDWK